MDGKENEYGTKPEGYGITFGHGCESSQPGFKTTQSHTGRGAVRVHRSKRAEPNSAPGLKGADKQVQQQYAGPYGILGIRNRRPLGNTVLRKHVMLRIIAAAVGGEGNPFHVWPRT